MREPLLTVSADRLVGEDGQAAEQAEHPGALGVLHAAIAAKYDVLAGLELHPADGAAWKLGCHWFTKPGLVSGPRVLSVESIILRSEECTHASGAREAKFSPVMYAGVPT